MITCTKGYPTITAEDVWRFFGDHEVWFGWSDDAPEELKDHDEPSNSASDFAAFKDCVQMLHTAEGMIFITFKRKAEHPYTVINDIMGNIADCGRARFDAVLVFAYHFMKRDGKIKTTDCFELSCTITKDYFEKEVKTQPGFRELKYENKKYFRGGNYDHIPRMD